MYIIVFKPHKTLNQFGVVTQGGVKMGRCCEVGELQLQWVRRLLVHPPKFDSVWERMTYKEAHKEKVLL